MTSYLLGIDAGTSSAKVLICDTTGNIVSISKQPWEHLYYVPEDLDPFGREFYPSQLWEVITGLVQKAMQFAGVPKEDIKGVSVTSQRHGCVFLDEDGVELYGGPNLDARGILTSYEIEELDLQTDLNVIYKRTGAWPPLIHAPARLLWFREEDPDIFQRIKYVLPISDWLTYKLTGNYLSEPSSASSTMMFDIHQRSWYKELLDALELDLETPPIIKSGEEAGKITSEASEGCGLAIGTQIIVAGSDTACAMLGGNVVNEGEVCAVLGSTAPVTMIINEPKVDPEIRRTLTGSFLLEGQWMLESNSGASGSSISWLKEALEFDTYDEMLAVASKVDSSEETYAFLGPATMDLQTMTELRPGTFIFPSPSIPGVYVSQSHLIHSAFDNVAFAVKSNLQQLQEVSGKEPEKTVAVGGQTNNTIQLQILADVLGSSVHKPETSENSALGAAICAAVGTGFYSDLREGASEMIKFDPPVVPHEARSKAYNTSFIRWKELYDKILNL